MKDFFPFKQMLQPETSLQYAIGWQTITYNMDLGA